MFLASEGCSISPNSLITKGLAHLELPQPFFAVVSLLLTEGKFDEFAVTFLGGREGDHMLPHIAEIISGVRILARSKTLLGVSYLRVYK